MSGPEDDRPVDLFEDGLEILPDTTSDERGPGWGDPDRDNNIERLLEERPPHW
ncbi:hypothetical protein ACFPZ0_03160 [Streptomonospora nanhaiensis]|uniref:Uncharacterized protein n=1 Tax=Streptomonospora nanhaiensis TaxID=1323731 RepID=A0A853BUN9_9ACTN|nr:hypothetical protein [Streptomonospora nanhaiensis]MBV2363455.1 hypothetical protein [Streptomonospora nanhaiensis]MBX9388371.1 hypothetical protein [Streptomonospora nanhaiensis]NYI98465.1 hypothetical protein [Streptomonospora nanhaiensis]